MKIGGTLEELLADLESTDWVERFCARHTLVFIGGRAVGALQELIAGPSARLRRTARWLLASIAADTAQRLGPRAAILRCPHCLVRCARLPIALPGLDLDYYGCRCCGQSRELREWPGEIVAILDSHAREERSETEGQMRVSWPHRTGLFDFDRVEILRAREENVERFALQVANDTDAFRRGRYRDMVCTVRPDIVRSENVRRILESLFGRVEFAAGKGS